MRSAATARPTVEQLETELRRLANRVGTAFAMPMHNITVASLSPKQPPTWRWAKGIYVFETDGIVQYIGRALGSPMWERVRKHITLGKPAWREVIENPRTKIRLYILDVDDVFWAASFETRLIELLRPAHNDRIA